MQLFGVAAITTGLALFALVLALVEQVVLQVLEENVQRGSRVYETGHVRPLTGSWVHETQLRHCSRAADRCLPIGHRLVINPLMHSYQSGSLEFIYPGLTAF